MTATRTSIPATYDSRETGDRYHVTTRVSGRTVTFQHRVPDPFVRQTVHVGWRDLLLGLVKRGLVVEVLVDGDRDVVEDVLELNDDYLGTNCTRRDTFNSHLMESAGRMVNGDD